MNYCTLIKSYISSGVEALTPSEASKKAIATSFVAMVVIGIIQHGFLHQDLGDVFTFKNVALNWTLIGLAAVWGFAVNAGKPNHWGSKETAGLIVTYFIAMALIIFALNKGDINLQNYFKDNAIALYICSALTASFLSYHLASIGAEVAYRNETPTFTKADQDAKRIPEELIKAPWQVDTNSPVPRRRRNSKQEAERRGDVGDSPGRRPLGISLLGGQEAPPSGLDNVGARFSRATGPLVVDIHQEVPTPLNLNSDSDEQSITLTDSTPTTPSSSPSPSRRGSREEQGALILPPDES